MRRTTAGRLLAATDLDALAISMLVGFVAADLLRDNGWAKTVAGMDVVLNVASPSSMGGLRTMTR